MRKKIIEKLTDEYTDNAERIYELEKEIDALGKKRLLSKFCVIALFGIVPTLIISFIASRFLIAGSLTLSAATAISTLTTVGISLINYGLYSKKFKFKEQFKQYNVSGSEKELLEREYDLVEKKKLLEIENQAILKYRSKLVNKQIILENNGLSEENVKKELEEKYQYLKDVTKLVYIGECFLDFENNNKSILKSFVYGTLCGMITSGIILYLPYLMAGIITTPTTQFVPNMLMTLTGLCFGTYNANNTKNIGKIYKKKKSEIKHLELPQDREHSLTKTYGLLHTATKDYVTAMKNNDSLELPRKENEVALEDEVKNLSPTKEKEVKLQLKY